MQALYYDLQHNIITIIQRVQLVPSLIFALCFLVHQSIEQIKSSAYSLT